MVTVPASTPVTIPSVGSMEAIVKSLLPHVPPLVGSASVVVPPGHTWVVPYIAPGKGFTVTVLVTMQPVASV